jgi:hypothetical protein
MARTGATATSAVAEQAPGIYGRSGYGERKHRRERGATVRLTERLCKTLDGLVAAVELESVGEHRSRRRKGGGGVRQLQGLPAPAGCTNRRSGHWWSARTPRREEQAPVAVASNEARRRWRPEERNLVEGKRETGDGGEGRMRRGVQGEGTGLPLSPRAHLPRRGGSSRPAEARRPRRRRHGGGRGWWRWAGPVRPSCR